MPVLNYDQKFTDMPDLDRLQECDACGVRRNGRSMFFSYKNGKTAVLCIDCFTLLGAPRTDGKIQCVINQVLWMILFALGILMAPLGIIFLAPWWFWMLFMFVVVAAFYILSCEAEWYRERGYFDGMY